MNYFTERYTPRLERSELAACRRPTFNFHFLTLQIKLLLVPTNSLSARKKRFKERFPQLPVAEGVLLLKHWRWSLLPTSASEHNLLGHPAPTFRELQWKNVETTM